MRCTAVGTNLPDVHALTGVVRTCSSLAKGQAVTVAPKTLGTVLNFMVAGDDRGSLTALESNKNVPFEIRRVYYIFGTRPGVVRGLHAHRALQQIAVCVSGACTMVLDDGHQRVSVRLDAPMKGVYIGPLMWREMHDFTSDCVLLVLADRLYDANDYVRDYDYFKQLVNQRG